MRVLFLGGTGNLSADCAALLAARGYEVAVVTRGKGPPPAGCRAVVADRYDARALKAALAGAAPDVVADFLAFRPEQMEVHAGLFAGRIRQLIFVSSATVYAKPHPVPVTEESPLGNRWSEYARQKQACEEWLAARARDLPFTIVRPSHTYSPRWIPNVVSSAGYTFAARLVSGRPVFVPDDGQALWTLTTARDFAAGFAGLVGNEAALSGRFHITSDEALTWNQITAEAARALGVDSPVVERIPADFICKVEPGLEAKLKGDKAHTAVFDNARIKRLVPGFECRDSVRAGMATAARWFDAHPDQKRADPAVDALWDKVVGAWLAR